MDFIPKREFYHPEVQSKMKRKRTSENVFISSYVYAPRDQYLFVGLTNGKICYWKKKNMEQKFLIDRGKDPELIELESPQHHKGDVKCLIYARIEGLDCLISGSADRTIKLWEPKNTKSNPCFQSIIGHGGTIISMALVQKVLLLVTASTDRTMRIWRIDKARQLLMYPWFVPLQIVKDFTSINASLIDNNVWVQCFDIKEGENLGIFAGDSEGSMLIFRAPEDWRNDCVFELAKKTPSIHRIGILQVLLVVQANFVFTISFDQQLKGFDATNGSEFFCIKNPNKSVYTSIFWDNQFQELYIADECGYIWVLNVYMEKPLIQKKIVDEKIKKIEIMEDTRSLLIHTDYGIRSYKVKRGQKSQDMLGHQGPILKIITLEPKKLENITRERIPDDPKIITCSLDNTIRLWDAKEMALVTMMESPEYSEISCMTFLINCCLVATGHEDGAIRLWNLEINSSVTLKCDENLKHNNSISCILGIFHKDSEFLICGSYDGKVSIWEISEKRSTNANSMLSSTIFPQLKTVIDNTKTSQAGKFDSTEILCLQFYYDNEESKQQKEGYVLVGGNNNSVNIWNVRTYEFVDALKEHTDSVTCMVIDANMLFTGSDDMTICIWEMKNWFFVGRLTGHKDSIQDMIILQENGVLISCSYDKTIMVWKYENKQLIDKYEKQEELRCMDYLSSTKTLFVGTNQKSILTINIEKLLDPIIKEMDFGNVGEEFNLDQELDYYGYKEGLHINDILNNQTEVNNIEDMQKIERLLQELKVKEDRDRDDPENRSEYLDNQEERNDEDLKLLLMEQERILKQDKQFK